MNPMKKNSNLKRRLPAATAAAIATAVLAITTASAVAGWRYLSVTNVANKLQDTKLEQAFSNELFEGGGEVQSYGGYEIALLGLVSGEALSDNTVTVNGTEISDGTYAVVAISKADGTPMPDTSEDSVNREDFLVSPYLEGYDPADYNIFTLKAGGYSEITEDGVAYRIMTVENIEAFADRTVYIGVTDGTFYNPDAFLYDAASGQITRNADYDGVNALFTLSIDPAKADPAKAKAMIRAVGEPDAEEDDASDAAVGQSEVEAFTAKLTPENIDAFAKPIEATRQTMTPDANGEFVYHYEFSDGSGGDGRASVEELFPSGQSGMSELFSFSHSDDNLKDLYIETYTRNEDGTVTFVVYSPKL